MKKPTLYELIGQVREITDSRFLNTNYIVEFANNNFSKFLNRPAVAAVCQIIIDGNFSSSYSVDEILDMAIYDYINP